MPRTLGYAHRVQIHAPVERVWSYLADPLHHMELHPLIRELTILSETEGPGPKEREVDFEVLDDVKLLGVQFPVRYRTHMIQRPATWTLSMRADSPPRLVIAVEWTLSPINGGTQLDEKVELTGPWIVAGFSVRQAQRAHMAMFAALQRVLE